MLNAIKFAPQNSSVIVRISVDAANATLSVTDHGPGISKVQQARLFKRFSRADGSGGSPAGSTGLGLYFVRIVAEKHNGSISVSSEEGSYTRFSLRLPIKNYE